MDFFYFFARNEYFIGISVYHQTNEWLLTQAQYREKISIKTEKRYQLARCKSIEVIQLPVRGRHAPLNKRGYHRERSGRDLGDRGGGSEEAKGRVSQCRKRGLLSHNRFAPWGETGGVSQNESIPSYVHRYQVRCNGPKKLGG